MTAATATKQSLTIKRRFNAPPAKVFAAWTDAKIIARWFGPEGVERVEATTDLRVAGAYHITMQVPGDQHDVFGVYREIVPNERLVFTWAWKSTPERESLVTVTFKPDGTGTMMTLLHEHFYDADARDRHQHGWSGAIDKLETLMA
ncbi:MAG: SRPBCC domain-containing protein [Hyphomicrobiales bacterium]